MKTLENILERSVGLVPFYSISTLVGYLMLSSVYIYIHIDIDIYNNEHNEHFFFRMLYNYSYNFIKISLLRFIFWNYIIYLNILIFP